MFARLTAFSILATALVLGGCAADTSSDNSESEEADLTAGAPVGNYEFTSSNDTFKAGDVYGLQLMKYATNNAKTYFVVHVVSSQCGFNREGATCPGAWVAGDDRSLDEYTGDAQVDEAKKTISLTYSVPKDDGDETEVTRTFKYSKLKTSLKLTENGKTIKLPKSADYQAPQDSVMAPLKKFMEEDGDISRLANHAPALAQIPIEVRRDAHYYNQSFGSDYPADIMLIELEGHEYYAVVKNNDGGGSTAFYSKEGVFLNEIGGGESSDWTWSH
ncbi:hypothetical protein AKJ09_08632 [Labilithrix luteola]|uniref:Lipoprotein n=1 Tax=Labilithrix luteola TaxID=1391654 RepID=A0A0K1Q8B4_9BACT|nr:hypothetical protein [Labilithrix luteola]AKV01969.1 hypothetical protein AKJ09_08632 [Labilithrix luteola]